MAMKPDDYTPAAATDTDGRATDDAVAQELATSVLVAAGHALKDYADQRWADVSDHVLRAALTASRPSQTIRAHLPSSLGETRVGQNVLAAYLRDAIDSTITHSATLAVHPVLDDDLLDHLVIEIVAQYGSPLLPLGNHIRGVATQTLATLLGPQRPAPAVHVTHVHVGNVTPDDPS